MDADLVRDLTDVGLSMIDDGWSEPVADDESRERWLHEDEAVTGPAPLSAELGRPVTDEPRRVH